MDMFTSYGHIKKGDFSLIESLYLVKMPGPYTEESFNDSPV